MDQKGIFFSPVVFIFSQQKEQFPQTPGLNPSLSPHMAFQKLGHFMNQAAEFRVYPPSALGKVRVFLKAVFTNMGSGGNVNFVGKK